MLEDSKSWLLRSEAVSTQKRTLRWDSGMWTTFAAGLVLALGAGVAFGCNASAPAAGTEAESPKATAPVMAVPAAAKAEAIESGKIADVVESVLPSVVSIASTRKVKAQAHGHFFFGAPPQEREAGGMGSGVILSADGLIVTNNHVVEGAETLTVRTHDEREFQARVVGTDPKSDLALVELVEPAEDLKPISVGNSSELRLGEVVLAVGNPFGVGQTVTMGIVSAKGRADMGIVDYEDFIQTDAAINPGNSGGALVNSRGQLVGINTAILSRSGGYMGIGFAIPTNMAAPILDALKNDGHVTRGWLGVSIQELSADLRGALGVGEGDGILIAEVMADGPAGKAGLQGGDVVTSVGDQGVQSAGHFRNLVASAGAGNVVALGVIRNGKPLTLKVALGELQDSSGVEAEPLKENAKEARPSVEGVVLRTLDSDLRRRLRVGPEVKGAVIVKVAPGSRAARAHLRAGDIILSLDRQPVASAEDAQRLYALSKGPWLLLVQRGAQKQYVVVK